MPTISVIMSIYNGGQFLNESIQSVLDQTYKDFELIVVNDASSDSTTSMLKAYKDSRIKIITNKKHLGLTKSLNKALKRSKGVYIARMDADDVSLPHRFTTQLSYFKKNKSLALVGSWGRLINEEGENIGVKSGPQSYKAILKSIMFFNPFIHPSVMYKKNIIDNLGGYDEKLDGAEDYDLFLRVTKVYMVQNIPEYLIKYRVLKNGVSWKHLRKVELATLRAKVRGITLYGYPSWYSISIVKGIIMYMVPSFMKKWVFFKFVYR